MPLVYFVTDHIFRPLWHIDCAWQYSQEQGKSGAEATRLNGMRRVSHFSTVETGHITGVKTFVFARE